MSKDVDDKDMSELEKEFELEMEEEPEGKEFEEPDEKEIEEEFEKLTELEEEPSAEFEDIEGEANDYAERFYELSTRKYESEFEVDDEINKLLYEMERDFFFKKLWRKLKPVGKFLLKKGLKLAAGLPAFKAVKGITQLARGDLKGALGTLAKAGLSGAVSMIPGGAAILPGLQALGFEATEDQDVNRQAWRNYVSVAKEAYDYLGRNLSENADDPIVANRLANEAFQSALKSVSSQIIPARAGVKKIKTIPVRKGDRIIIRIKGV